MGPLRLRAPVRPWSGVRHCHAFAACARSSGCTAPPSAWAATSRPSEDCLTLNITAPEHPGEHADGGPLPVMVFIHSGA